MKQKLTLGAIFTHPILGRVKVIAILDCGTIDVQNIFSDKCYRISGLPII